MTKDQVEEQAEGSPEVKTTRKKKKKKQTSKTNEDPTEVIETQASPEKAASTEEGAKRKKIRVRSRSRKSGTNLELNKEIAMHPKANSPPLPTADELKGEIQKTDSSNIIIDTENGELSVHEITPAVKNSPVDNVVDSRSTEEAEAIDVLQTENVEEKPKRKKKKVRSKKSTTKETTEQPPLEFRGQVDCEPVAPEPVKDGDTQIKHKEISSSIPTPDELSGETQNTDPSDIINIENETTKEAEPGSKRKKKKVRSRKSRKDEESLFPIVPTPINDEPILSTEEHVISPEKQPVECEDQLEHISGQTNPESQNNVEEKPKRKKKKVRSKKSNTKEMTDQTQLEFRGQVDCEPILSTEEHVILSEKQPIECEDQLEHISGQTDPKRPGDCSETQNPGHLENEEMDKPKRKKKKVRSKKVIGDENFVPTEITEELENHIEAKENKIHENIDDNKEINMNPTVGTPDELTGETPKTDSGDIINIENDTKKEAEVGAKRKKKKVRSRKSKKDEESLVPIVPTPINDEPAVSIEEHVISPEIAEKDRVTPTLEDKHQTNFIQPPENFVEHEISRRENIEENKSTETPHDTNDGQLGETAEIDAQPSPTEVKRKKKKVRSRKSKNLDTENCEFAVQEITPPALENPPVNNLVVESRSTEKAVNINASQNENVEEKPKRKKKKVRSKKSTTKETTEQPSLELRGQVDCEPVVPEPVKDGDAQIKPKEISPPISTPNELTGETQKTDSTDVINIENETTKEAEPSSKRKKKKVRSKKSKKEEESLVSIVPTPINDEPILSTEEHVISPERQPIECEDQLKHISGQADPKCQENDEERPKRKKKKVRSKKSTTKETTEQPSLEFRGQVDCEPVAPEPVKDGDTQINESSDLLAEQTPAELKANESKEPSDITPNTVKRGTLENPESDNDSSKSG